MKKIIIFLLICCSHLSYCKNFTETIILDSNWTFSQSGSDIWRKATVPGTVHQDLLNHQLLPDPFYGTNETKIQWVEHEDWEYKTTFSITPSQLKHDAAQLIFEGLDTYADVYLNGSLILKADNMFVGYKIPVKEVLREGENKLYIRFRSPIRETRPQWESNGFNYPADNDHSPIRTSIFTRKAPYSYGWDWGIRMVTSGIWRPVKLQFYDIASIEDYHLKQLKVTKQKAEISHRIEINNVSQQEEKAEIIFNCSLNGKNVVTLHKNVHLTNGINQFEIPATIEHPQLWMPNGWGNPTLYDFSAYVVQNGDTLSDKHLRIGLRSIEIINEKDQYGESFYVKVNGIPLFAKGANYIPSDALLPSMTDERYNMLFNDIRKANMNMIRVWGGGIYEDDRFYRLADENGILIWQDFMFACTAYPGDPTFLKRVEEEAEYNIKRLRNHACLALWCGNNEILEGLKYWGWKSKYTQETYERFLHDYDRLFCQLLSQKVHQLDSGRFYTHTSPYFSNWGRPDSWNTGDSHNWGIWYGKKPFESSDSDSCRFMSEFGFQSFPEMKTIATFASPKDYQIESEIMNAHQKSTIGNSLIKTYMERYFIVPDNFEDFVYVGLVLQGEGVARGLKAHRRTRPYCMGTLYWQLNDSWPVVSWSSIDYYGNWKALHYQAAKAFAPVLINPIQQDSCLNIYLISDRLDSLSDLTLDMQLIDFNGKKIKRQKIHTMIASNCSKRIFNIPVSEYISEELQKRCFLQLTLTDRNRKEIARSTYFFKYTKDLDLPQCNVEYHVKTQEGKCEVTLTSSKLAKDVFIQIPIQGARFSDNFFDLLPGEKRKITIISPKIHANNNLNITIKHIRETY